MDVRGKLVELLNKANSACIDTDCCECCKFYMENDCLYKLMADLMIANCVTVQEWISVKDRLPENSKKEGAFCPRYFVMTKYGESFGWYNPNFKSWFVLFWFFTDRLLEKEIDFERADVPKIVKVPDGVVTHWMSLPQPPKGE